MFILFFVSYFSFSQTAVPSFFADSMVLQQQEDVAIWGKDTSGISVQIEASWGESVNTKTDEDGTWEVELKTPEASFDTQTITITGSSKIDIKNVLVGEVWFCSGQSNMEMPLKGFDKSPVNRSDTFLDASDNPDIRLFNAPRTASLSPKMNISGTWQMASRTSVEEFSAVGYMFGKKLFDRLQIPIGIIESAWGGTRIEAWLPKSKASAYSEIIIPKSLSKKESRRKKPTALYNAMIHPFRDYAIKGVLWYQGETNRHNPGPYKQYMHDLVDAWRIQWNRPELPFYMVQIAPYGYAKYRDGKVLDANRIREAQALAAQEIPNTGIVITTDVGKCDDIHPPEKETIADRMATMAFAEQYGMKDSAYRSPEYKTMRIEGNKIHLSFDFGGETEANRQFDANRKITDFEIAGEDKKFRPAQVTINENQTLTVSSDNVKEPVAVRYGFVDCLEGSLFSRAGLPVSPFRTDSWNN